MKSRVNRISWSLSLVLIIWLLFVCHVKCEDEDKEQITISDFNNKIFWEKDHQGMIPLDLGFNKFTDAMMIIAVADMNGDKYTDIITINQERSAFRLFLYNINTKTFENGDKEFPTECMISNLQDMKTSRDTSGVLVTCSKPESVMKLYAYDDNLHDFTEIKTFKTRIKENTNPFIADFNGDFYPDVLFQSDNGIEIFFSSGEKANPYENYIKNLNEFVVSKSEHHKCIDAPANRHLASPGSVGYVDIDGDCVSDLILTTQDSSSKKVYVEIYITMLSDHSEHRTSYSFSTKYCLIKREPLPDDIDPLLLFADFDREGMIDILGFSPTKKQIYIFLNGLPPRPTVAEGLWYVENQLEQEAEVFPALNGDLSLKPSDYVMFHKIYQIPYFKALHGHTDVFPARLRFSDINADGYPDLIGTFELSDHNAFPVVLINKPWTDPEKENCKKKDRLFVYDDSKYNSELKKHNDCNYAFFFDIEENGQIDIILSIHDVNQRKDKILPLMSNFNQDSFFLKTKVVRNVNAKNDVLHSGATIRAAFTQFKDENYILVGTQKSQESFANLGISYAYFGIGRSTNYIEKFTVGAMIQNKKVVRSWSPIIPNTQLLVSCEDSSDAKHWKLDLLVGPTKVISLLVIVLSLFLMILGLLIIIMHFSEKAEDEKQVAKAFDFL